MFVKIRSWTGIVHTEDGKVLSWPDWTPLYCVWCTSIYVAVVLMFVPIVILLPLAASCMCIVIQERLT